MKAAIFRKYGPPEVVSVQDVPVPRPADHEILVRVIASTVNRTDCGFRSAEYFVSRFWSGLLRPKMHVLGCEFAGIVEITGGKVTGFRKGDRVFGYNDQSFGCHAEFLTIAENGALTIMPQSISFEEAAPITEGAHYALNVIRAAGATAGQDVLVYGATGAIGSAAVQLLRHFGTNVTAVCNAKNAELVKSLGAERVVVYEKEDFTLLDERYDWIFDAVGKSSFGECKPLLKEKGIYISTELGKHAENVFYALTSKLRRGRKVLFPLPTISKADVVFLKSLVEKGEYRPVIDRHYSLQDIVEAYRYVETRQKTGNVVLRVSEGSSSWRNHSNENERSTQESHSV